MKAVFHAAILAAFFHPYWQFEAQNNEYDYFRHGRVCAVVSIEPDGYEGYSLRSGDALTGLPATKFATLDDAETYASMDCPK